MLVEAEIWTVAKTDKGTAVLVRPLGSDRAVPIFIGQLEAHSILIGLGNVSMPRPLTHDLILQIFEKFHTVIERIEINDLQDSTYFARIILKQGMKKIVLDARPSDALGLAARVKCPVYIAEYIVDEASIPVNMIEDGETENISMELGESHEDFAKMTSASEGESEEEKRLESLLETPQDVQRSVLKTQLEQAIQEENYEEAARLRDIITRLES